MLELINSLQSTWRAAANRISGLQAPQQKSSATDCLGPDCSAVVGADGESGQPPQRVGNQLANGVSCIIHCTSADDHLMATFSSFAVVSRQ
jgi:hypothetical protein